MDIMEEWVGEFLYELFLIIGAIWIGVSVGSLDSTSAFIPFFGMFFVLIAVFIKLRYPR